MLPRLKIAIVGAGIAGLAAARILAKNFEVTVFEKSRGLGGRLSTRYASPFEFESFLEKYVKGKADFGDYMIISESKQLNHCFRVWNR